tara:strand:- start:759 stop:2120 length:1362 start_codon:yes stop_codon:yes gene_type:complete
MNGKELNNNLHKLLRHLDSIKDTLPMVLLLLRPYQKKAGVKLEEFIENNVTELEEEKDGKKLVSIPVEQTRVFDQLSKNSHISSLASKIIPESLFVSLISQYDSYLNQLLRILFNIRPEYINNSDRELTFSDLNNFKSIEEAREFIIEKEVESVLRKSHSEHFTYLENKIGMPLKKDLPIWKTFIEITERRNLFVHCDGIVSSQYIKVCKENKCLPKDIKLNQRLIVDSNYFDTVYECLYEITTKLTHTIWRKLISEDIKQADGELNDICYNLLTDGKYKLADILLDFACKQTKHFNDASKNVYIINKSLSQYLQDNKENAIEIIESKDWSASSDNFKMAHLILSEKFDEVYNLMKKIGKDGDINKEDYKTWPLFFKLRNQEEFKNLYKEIFEEDYKVLEIPKRPIQELIEELIENKTVKSVPKKKIPSKKTNVKKLPVKKKLNKKEIIDTKK